MRKTFLAVSLAVMSVSAIAGWVKIAGDEVQTAYADSSTVRKAGDKAKIWGLLDFKKAKTLSNGDLYLSQKSLHEYDCKEEQGRGLFSAAHSENMGRGDQLASNDKPREWQPVTPDSMNAALFKIACGGLGR